jgi:hypothetical protein
MKTMNKYLTDKDSDLSVALIAKTGNWYLFIIQPQKCFCLFSKVWY